MRNFTYLLLTAALFVSNVAISKESTPTKSKRLKLAKSECFLAMDSVVTFDPITNNRLSIIYLKNDASNRPTSVVEYAIDPATDHPIMDEIIYKTEMSYDSAGNMIEEIVAEEGYHNKTVYVYVDNKLKEETDYRRDSESDPWVKKYTEEYVYDEQGRLIEENSSSFNDEGESSNWYFLVKEYNEQGKLKTEKTYQVFDGVKTLTYTYTYIYDEKGFLKLREEEGALGWDNSENKQEYICDDKGHVLFETSFRRDDDNIWQAKYQTEYAYDENGKVLIDATYERKNNIWVGMEKLEYTYNECGQQASFKGYSDWSESEGWIMDEYQLAYFTSTSGIGEIESEKGRVYLVNNQLVVTYSNVSLVEVYSLSGALVLKTKETTISTNEWNKDVYIVKVQSQDGRVESTKIAK